MFELLNSIESLTKETKQNKIFMFFLNQEIEERKIVFSNIVILGKTHRKFHEYSQETYIGILNDTWFFYIEIENNQFKTILVNKDIELVFDIFYSREIIKEEKDYNLKEIKSMLLYKKLYLKMINKSKEKFKKI